MRDLLKETAEDECRQDVAIVRDRRAVFFFWELKEEQNSGTLSGRATRVRSIAGVILRSRVSSSGYRVGSRSAGMSSTDSTVYVAVRI